MKEYKQYWDKAFGIVEGVVADSNIVVTEDILEIDEGKILSNSLELADELMRTDALCEIADAIRSLSDSVLKLSQKKG
jgi:hypothetical protein